MTSTPARRNQIADGDVAEPADQDEDAARCRTSLVARSPAGAATSVHGAAGPPVHHCVAAKYERGRPRSPSPNVRIEPEDAAVGVEVVTISMKF